MENSGPSFCRVTAAFLQLCLGVGDFLVVSVEPVVFSPELQGLWKCGKHAAKDIYKSLDFFSGIFRVKKL